MNNKLQFATDYFSTDHLKTDLKKRAIRSGGITILSRTTSFCIQMIGTVVLARLLTPADFGLVAMVTSITGFFLIFKDLGLTDATIQQTHIDHKKISTLFWINLTFSVGIVLLIITLSPCIAWFYGEPQLRRIAVISSLSFIFAGLSTQHLALLKRSMSFHRIAFIEIAATSASIVTGILLAWYGWGYWALVTRPIVLAMSLTLGAWIFCEWRPRFPSYRSGVRSMLAFGANTLGFFLVNYFVRSLDKILIGWRYTVKDLGYYYKAFYLSLLPVNQLTIPLQSVAVTTLSKLRDEPVKYRRYYTNALSAISFLGMPISAFVALESSDLILLLLGPQWGRTAEIFSILVIGAGFQMINSTRVWLHLSLGRADRLLLWGIFGSSVTIVAILLGLSFSVLGVSIAYTLSIYLLTVPGILYAGKPINLKFSSVISAIWRYFLAAASAGFIYWYISSLFDITSNLFLRIIFSLLLFLSLYLVFIVVLFLSTKPIKQFLDLIGEMFPGLLLRKSR